MNNFAKNLKLLRKIRNWTQDKMEEYGFTRTRWSSYENSVAEPSISDLVRIAEIFNITETELIHANIESEKEISKWAEKKANSKKADEVETTKALEYTIAFLENEVEKRKNE